MSVRGPIQAGHKMQARFTGEMGEKLRALVGRIADFIRAAQPS